MHDDPENTPIYPTEADRQCLKLSEKLWEARQNEKAARADLALLNEAYKAALAEIETLKQHLNGK